MTDKIAEKAAVQPRQAVASVIEPRAVSVRDAAAMLGFKEGMGYKLIKEGRLKAFRPRRGGYLRVAISAVEELLQEGEGNGAKTRRR